MQALLLTLTTFFVSSITQASDFSEKYNPIVCEQWGIQDRLQAYKDSSAEVSRLLKLAGTNGVTPEIKSDASKAWDILTKLIGKEKIYYDLYNSDGNYSLGEELDLESVKKEFSYALGASYGGLLNDAMKALKSDSFKIGHLGGGYDSLLPIHIKGFTLDISREYAFSLLSKYCQELKAIKNVPVTEACDPVQESDYLSKMKMYEKKTLGLHKMRGQLDFLMGQ